MKSLSRILTIVLCFAPLCADANSPVATTAGSNLTAFNPSTANNNQWAMISNGRYDGNTSAKVDFGNCNSVILRCAQPKCSNGGCSDMSVASAIVAGCVQSNDKCKQYGNDLVQYMSAQLVANSNAKINEQNAAAQQAAAVAAQQAAQQSQQQMQEMQYQMQQMQAQMAQQQAESQQQLQAALAQQAAQSQAAIENMKAAATTAAMETEAGISAYQQDAINRGVSTDILERQKIAGQVMTELENAEVSLAEVKKSMNSAFEYAGCDSRGNNCTGPKRVKKWRELATGFLDPYDNTIDKVYDALKLAQLVGVDLSDIYMMLNNSCNSWGQYMCEKGEIEYVGNTPYSCFSYTRSESGEDETKCIQEALSGVADTNAMLEVHKNPRYLECKKRIIKAKNCKPCTFLKMLSAGEEIYDGWVNPTADSTQNGTVIACASSALESSVLFSRRTKNKNGAGLVDIDKLDTWLNQKEPPKMRTNVSPLDYCNAEGYEDILEKSMLTKTVPVNNHALCVKEIKPGQNEYTREDSVCGYINPLYAICDTHLFNVGKRNASESGSKDPDDCTTWAKDSEIADSKDFVNKSAITWAHRDKRNDNSSCKVKHCSANYKPKEDGKGCEATTDDDYKSDGKKYKANAAAYRQAVSAEYARIKEMISLKTTVISQQMYKQYEYLSATLRRLKTQLEKATLTANLEAAGGKSETSSSSGLLGGGSSGSQYRDCTGKNKQGTVDCLRENYSVLSNQVNNKKCDRKCKNQIQTELGIMNSMLGTATKSCTKKEDNKDVAMTDKECLQVLNGGYADIDSIILKEEADRRGYGLR